MADDRRWVGGGDDAAAPGRRITPKAIGIGALVIVVVIVIAQNTDETQLDVLFFSFNAGLWLMLTLTAVLGVAIGLLLGRRRYRQ